MNRRHFAFSLPAAAGLLIGCKSRSNSSIQVDTTEVQDSLRSLEASIGGLEMDINSIRDSNCQDMATAVGGAAASVRTSFDDLKRAMGSPNL